jgi:hypothetical protein
MQRIEMENRIQSGVRSAFRYPQNPTAVIPMVERRCIQSEREIWHCEKLNCQFADESEQASLAVEPPKIFKRLIRPRPGNHDSRIALDAQQLAKVLSSFSDGHKTHPGRIPKENMQWHSDPFYFQWFRRGKIIVNGRNVTWQGNGCWTKIGAKLAAKSPGLPQAFGY